MVLTHPTDKRAPLWGLAISTRKDLDASDPIVEMPWDATTGSTTGLYEWCEAVLLWPVNVPQDQINNASGHVSGEFLERVEKALEAARLEDMARRQHRH